MIISIDNTIKVFENCLEGDNSQSVKNAIETALMFMKHHNNQFDKMSKGKVLQTMFPDDLWLHIHARRAKEGWFDSPFVNTNSDDEE